MYAIKIIMTSVYGADVMNKFTLLVIDNNEIYRTVDKLLLFYFFRLKYYIL